YLSLLLHYPPSPQLSTLSLHDALPIFRLHQDETNLVCTLAIDASESMQFRGRGSLSKLEYAQYLATAFSHIILQGQDQVGLALLDRKSTRLNSSHVKISYAVFCLKKKK